MLEAISQDKLEEFSLVFVFVFVVVLTLLHNCMDPIFACFVVGLLSVFL